MTEPAADRDTCALPLPGTLFTPGQAERMLALWAELCQMQEHPIYARLRAGWQADRFGQRQAMRDARDAERVATARLRYAVAGFPDEICTALGSLAVSAASGGATSRVPSAFASGDEAMDALNQGMAYQQLVNLPGWQAFSGFLAALAWAFDLCAAQCKEGDVPFYVEARRSIEQMFANVQAVIDRGVDAAAWLHDEAERERKETQ